MQHGGLRVPAGLCLGSYNKLESYNSSKESLVNTNTSEIHALRHLEESISEPVREDGSGRTETEATQSLALAAAPADTTAVKAGVHPPLANQRGRDSNQPRGLAHNEARTKVGAEKHRVPQPTSTGQRIPRMQKSTHPIPL